MPSCDKSLTHVVKKEGREKHVRQSRVEGDTAASQTKKACGSVRAWGGGDPNPHPADEFVVHLSSVMGWVLYSGGTDKVEAIVSTEAGGGDHQCRTALS